MVGNVIEVLVFAARALLGIVLIMAGAAKLVDVSGFARTLAGLMPRSTATDETIRALAVAIPMGELLLGVVVITGLWSTVTDVCDSATSFLRPLVNCERST